MKKSKIKDTETVERVKNLNSKERKKIKENLKMLATGEMLSKADQDMIKKILG